MSKPPAATVPLHTGAEVRFRRIVVQVEEGDDMGKWAASGGEELAIGSAAGNDLVLTDATVSRHHCSITARADGFVLRDLASMNGTFLGGFRIETAYLKHGASLRVGRTKLRFQQLEEEIREPLSEADRFGTVLGRSAPMRRIFALMPKLAASDTTLLIEGETGTGKGLLARAIHEAGPRAQLPFVVIDCASIPATLVESELFGHMRGSFTGAHADRPGAFEAASGGTVFLDEIGELPLDMQPKLLRALEDRRVKRIGGTQPVELDVRVIAATNRDLRAEVNRGGFRADLYYRLHIAHLRVPPLRDRREDIELYVHHFFEQLAPDEPSPPRELVASLARQDFPGNVRELRAAIERAVLLGAESLAPAGPGDDRAALDAPAFDPSTSFRVAKERAMAAWERAYLRDLLEACHGNISKAARVARMDRNHLRELLRRRGLGAV
jgi:DNA-binding NtrC family response regulator